MELNYCRRCGEELNSSSEHVFRCKNNHTIFKNSAPAVGLILINEEDKILLSVRGIEPDKGLMDMVGGFVDGTETFEEAVNREIKEELNLQPSDYSKIQYVSSHSRMYKYQNEEIPCLTNFYWARILKDVSLRPSDDVADIVKIDLEDIDLGQIGGQDAIDCLKQLLDMEHKPWQLPASL